MLRWIFVPFMIVVLFFGAIVATILSVPLATLRWLSKPKKSWRKHFDETFTDLMQAMFPELGH